MGGKAETGKAFLNGLTPQAWLTRLSTGLTGHTRGQRARGTFSFQSPHIGLCFISGRIMQAALSRSIGFQCHAQ